MKIWMDVKNTCEPVFFKVLMEGLKDHDFFITARDFAGSPELLEEIGVKHTVVGKHYGGSIIAKGLGTIHRSMQLMKALPKIDATISSENPFSPVVSRFKSIPSISFQQASDIDNFNHKMWDRLNDYIIKPEIVGIEPLVKNGVRRDAIHSFTGFKEQIPVADFKPDPEFLDKIPFTEYIAIRPPPLSSFEVGHDVRSNKSNIIRELAQKISKEGFNILYLTRYPYDQDFVRGIENVHILKKPLNGLDIAWHSQGIMTGSGTFAREAAAMNVPAATSYDYLHHKVFLPVDKMLIDQGKMLNSKDPENITTYLKTASRSQPNLNNAIQTKNQVIAIIEKILSGIAESS
jgi:uncharacterized protein